MDAVRLNPGYNAGRSIGIAFGLHSPSDPL